MEMKPSSATKENVETKPNSDFIPGKTFQMFATLTANFLATADGMVMGWTSPMIPYFLSERTHIQMTKGEAEWIERFTFIGGVCALPLTAYLVNKIGRRKSLMLSCFVLVLCWSLIALTNQLLYIYIARFMQGIGLNLANVAMPMYVSEISHKKIRGLLTGSIYIFMLVGVLIIYSIGPYVPYYVPSILAASLLGLEFLIFYYLPESPYYLFTIGKTEEAKKSLQTFRGTSNIDDEVNEIQFSMVKNKNEGGNLKDLVVVPNNRRAMLILLVLNFAQLFGSFEVILMNLHEILEVADSIYLDPSLTAIIYSIVMLISSMACSLVVDRFGRRILLIISTITTGMCVLTLAIYFNLQALGFDIESISWIPIVCVMFYASCFKFGLGTVTIVITAEIFSQKIRAIGMTLGDGSYIVSSIAALQVFFSLKEFYGLWAPFYIFSCCLFSVLPFIIFFIPETKGKSLDEIQEILKGQKFF